jgi:hypothetical protein
MWGYKLSPTVVKKSKSSELPGYAYFFIKFIASKITFGRFISFAFAKSPKTTKLTPFFESKQYTEDTNDTRIIARII